MSNELFFSGDTNVTVKALIKRGNTRWNGSNMTVNAAISDDTWTTGMVTLTELLTDNDTRTGDYVGDFPAGITEAGDYIVEYLVSATPTPGMRGAKQDLVLWDGTAKVDLALLAHVLAVVAGETRPHVVQTVTISGSPTGGTFALRYDGATTGQLAYDASAATVETALEGLAGIGSGNVTVSGSDGGPYTVTFGGDLDLTALEQLTAPGAQNLLSGGSSPEATVATTVRYLARDGSTAAATITYAPTDGSRTDSVLA